MLYTLEICKNKYGAVMQCPRCNCIKKIIKVSADSRDSTFECRSCLAVFLYDSGQYYVFREKGSRNIPVIFGIILLLIVTAIIYLFGINLLTIVIGVLLSLAGFHSIKIGLFDSQEVIDQMILGNSNNINEFINNSQ